METTNIRISKSDSLWDIVSHIKRGEWKIPRFQREFVWEKRKVIDLLDSIYKNFPIGSFFLWIPPSDYRDLSRDIPELQIDSDEGKRETKFILDGQQRLTSLYATIRGLSIDHFDYSRICFDLDKGEFNADPADTEKNISLSVILGDAHLPTYNGLTDDRKLKFQKVRDRFLHYPFPVIEVEDKSLEDACKIFERINQGGKRLGLFDLVVAVTWDKDFELNKKTDEFNREIKDSFGELDKEVFAQTLSLIVHKQCTKAFQLRLKPEHVKAVWAGVEKAITRSIQFLRTDLNVVHYDYLPYRDMLPLVAYYFYHKKDTEINKPFLEEWFWKAAFSNRYSSSTFTRMGEDRAYLFDRALNNEKWAVNYPVHIDAERIKSVQMGRTTALRNAILLALLNQVPKSFTDNRKVDVSRDAISEFNRAEKHHIFPRKFLKSVGITDSKIVDSIVNFCFIDESLNREISGKAPKEYFSFYKGKNNGLSASLASHLIPAGEDSGIWSNDYSKFMGQRAALLERLIKSKLGDATAKIEERMATNLPSVVQEAEQKLREVVNSVLYEGYGENWWERSVPEDVQAYVRQKIKEERANKPYISDEEWRTPQRLLEQTALMHCQKIVLKNWTHFEDIFGSKETFETRIKEFSTLRNQINHVKTIDSTEKKTGEAAIEWLLKCLQQRDEKAMAQEDETEYGPFYVHRLYDDLKKRILALDPEVEENKKKYYIGFRKGTHIYFTYLSLKRDKIAISISAKKGSLEDPKGMARDRTEKDSSEKRWFYFELRSFDELDYALSLIAQAYRYNEESVKESGDKAEEEHLRGKSEVVASLYQKLKGLIARLDANVQFIPQKYYIGVKGRKNFAYLVFRKNRIRVAVCLPFDDARKIINSNKMKELSRAVQSYYGGSAFDFSLDDEKDLADLFKLLELAYEKQTKPS